MNKNPLQSIINLDKTIFESMDKNRSNAFGEGKLEMKYKYLTAMALDATHGTKDGTRVLAQLAMENGATKEEIAETLKILHYISGGVAMYCAGAALDGLF